MHTILILSSVSGTGLRRLSLSGICWPLAIMVWKGVLGGCTEHLGSGNGLTHQSLGAGFLLSYAPQESSQVRLALELLLLFF